MTPSTRTVEASTLSPGDVMISNNATIPITGEVYRSAAFPGQTVAEIDLGSLYLMGTVTVLVEDERS